MNKYIIDTHVLLWLIFKPDQIKKSNLVVLEDTDNEIFATSISFWEISLKYGLGKLDLQGLEPKDIPIVTKEMGIEILEIRHELMSSYNELPQVKNHKDPFDSAPAGALPGTKPTSNSNELLRRRIMIWHCIKNNCFFVTQDSKLEDYQKFGLRYLS